MSWTANISLSDFYHDPHVTPDYKTQSELQGHIEQYSESIDYKVVCFSTVWDVEYIITMQKDLVSQVVFSGYYEV